jgi:hypothetical protein
MFGDFCTNLYIVGDRATFQPDRQLVEAIVDWCNSYRGGGYSCESIEGSILSRERVDRHFQDWGDIVAEAEGIDRQEILQEFVLAAWDRLGEITPEVLPQLSNLNLPGISTAERQNIQQLRINRNYWVSFLMNAGWPAVKKVHRVCRQSSLNINHVDIFGILLDYISSPQEFFNKFNRDEASENPSISSRKAYAYKSILYGLYDRLRRDYSDPNIGRSDLSIPFRYSSKTIAIILRDRFFMGEDRIELSLLFIRSTKEYLREQKLQINNLTIADFNRIANYIVSSSPLLNINITSQQLKDKLEDIGFKLRTALHPREISFDESYSIDSEALNPPEKFDPNRSPRIAAVNNFFHQHLQHLQESNSQDFRILCLYYSLGLKQGEIGSILEQQQSWISRRITKLTDRMYREIQEKVVNSPGSLQMTQEQDIEGKRATIEYLRLYMADRLRQVPRQERVAYIADRTGLPLPLPDRVREAIERINREPHT